MLVKVVLSYYMEGEHSQGAKQLLGLPVWELPAWGVERRTGRTGGRGRARPSGRTRTPVGDAPLMLPPQRAGWFGGLATERWKRSVICVIGCWDRWETGVDSARNREPSLPPTPLGDGWPSQVRAVDAPA